MYNESDGVRFKVTLDLVSVGDIGEFGFRQGELVVIILLDSGIIARNFCRLVSFSLRE